MDEIANTSEELAKLAQAAILFLFPKFCKPYSGKERPYQKGGNPIGKRVV